MDHEGEGPGGPVTSREQDAVRLLLLIDGACEPLSEADRVVPLLEHAVGVMRTQVKLQKLDFWLRNPDYLANELLTEYENDREEALLDIADRILRSEEPEVRRYPMLRHHFGAYEWLDDALAVLRSAGLLVRRRRGTVNRVRQHDYFLLEEGRRVSREIIREAPAFDYYVQRVELVLRLAGEKSGSELKKQQYLTREYAETPRGTRIASISEQARRRLTAIRHELQEQEAGAA
ncbi:MULTISPECIES: hypothetical protein [unclassified Streptomyces]|uniref:hypothetical protein n=1 Tax=unclassified Streptomyces TaxID=2593676 RepID=UPI002242C0AB|nr:MULTISPECIES: hypothetical protein [unclassified Streptomyces]MCX4530956.1 hypothetical protein [Streptomyces sp. NBC_01669]UZI27240.1 hypothetical protein OH133_03440 [Streptomyces sp. VB1]